MSSSRIWGRTLTHVYEDCKLFPLAEETKESLQSASLELYHDQIPQLLIEVVDNRYHLELERQLEQPKSN